MILVTVGMSKSPFDRLLRAVDELPIHEPLVVQHGRSRVLPAQALCRAYVSYDELVDYVRRARVVITHAGVGSVALALMAEKRPIVVPRLRRFGEAVDDHQVLLARTLHGQGLVRLVNDVGDLSRIIDEPPPDRVTISRGSSLATDLRECLSVLVTQARSER